MQEIHRWRFRGIIIWECHSEAELLSGVDGTFGAIDCDDPNPAKVTSGTIMEQFV